MLRGRFSDKLQVEVKKTMNFLKRLLPKRVKTKLILSLGTLIALMVLIPVLLVYRNTINTTVKQAQTALQKEVVQVRDKLIVDTTDQLSLLAHTVADIPSVKKDLFEQDREDLLSITLPMYKNLKSIVDLNVFHFHLPPAISFLRLQKPQKFGDDLSGFRHTVVSVNRDRKEASGIEVGRAGLSVRAVVPVSYQGRHAGSVEFGAPINDKLANTVKKIVKSDISVLVPDGNGFKYQGKSGNQVLPKQDFPFLREIMQDDKTKIIRVSKDNRELMIAYMPLQDYSGKTVGILAVPRDITDQLAVARKSALTIALAGFLAICLIQALVYFIFQRMIDRPLSSINAILEAASRGDLSRLADTESISGVDCSEIMQCNKPDCSMYGKTGYCWEEAGSAAAHTQCPNILSGEFHSCSECKACFGMVVQDEFSELNAYLHAFIANIRNMVSDIHENSNHLNTSSDHLATISDEMDGGASASAQRSESVAAAAEEMSSNMSSIAAATEEAAANVNMMTTATEEISSTVNEIQHSTANAKKITDQAVTEASDISSKVDELGNSAQDIGKVTETITEISSQTNLLALNATIEAARAGEAGKGFAVVANEIKDLAKQTAEATGEIKQRIDGIQSSTSVTVKGIRTITQIINEIDEIVSNIASALDEQSNTMTELTTNIQQAGEGIGEVAENVAQSSAVSQEIATDVAQVNQAAKEISQGTGQVKEKADELKQYAADLRILIEKFNVN